MDCFVANYVHHHGLVNFYDCDWPITRSLDNPHARTLLTIESGDRHGRTCCSQCTQNSVKSFKCLLINIFIHL